MIVHRKDFRKQNSKLNILFSIENVFHKSLSQRTYQWGTQERHEIEKLKKKQIIFSLENQYQKKLSARSFQ